MLGNYEHHQSKWTDSALHPLEEWLSQVLQEIELRAAAAEQARLAAIEAAELRRRQWERSMEQAEEDYRDAYLGQLLDRQLDDWRRANQLGDYLDAMHTAIDSTADPEDATAARQWFQWARKRAASLDPLRQRISMPAIPAATPEDLKPFLYGISPYGPDSTANW